MTVETYDEIRSMHHRRLPAGSTETLQRRLATVNASLETSAQEVARLEDLLRGASLDSHGSLLDEYHRVVRQHRLGLRARKLLDGALRERSEGDG